LSLIASASRFSAKVGEHGADKRRVWRKVHLVIDADSHEVRAAEVMAHRHGDEAYDTRDAYETSAARQANLVVPPRRNGKPWKRRTTGATERNKTLRAIRHLGRRL